MGMAIKLTENALKKILKSAKNLTVTEVQKAVQVNNYMNTPKTADGFDSKYERKKYFELKAMLQRKEIKEFWWQYPIDLICNKRLVCQYIMDYVVLHNNGKIELIECKGYSLDVWKLKYKMLHAMYHNHPNIIMTVDYQESWGKKKVQKPPESKKLPKNYKSQF